MREWSQLEQIARLKFLRDAQKIAQLTGAAKQLSRERTSLKQENLRAIDTLRREQAANLQGGQGLWQQWLGRSLIHISTQEAQIRAQAEFYRPKARHSFGKWQVVRQLSKRSDEADY